MKIRLDFVTNSSSTSYLISLKGKFTLENFTKAAGVDKTPWLGRMFSRLFKIISGHNKEISDVVKMEREYYDEDETLDSYLERAWPDREETVKALLAAGRKVYVGSFEDGGMGASELECLFCADSFFLENDEIFFDASEERY
ncbi:MAG: hypothetical protein LBP95_02740 [Deltaproteobacteria bacterium]|jgi:hypothetical protein|nr:hypothetical protein [Deltaproteobacteria bacterium]